MTFSQEEAVQRIFRQARLLTDPHGPYHDFARTGDIHDLAKVYSPIGASNDIHGTNATEAAGILANMAKSFDGRMGAAPDIYDSRFASLDGGFGSRGGAPMTNNIQMGDINLSAMFEDLGEQITAALEQNMEVLFEQLERIADLRAERSVAV
jgi:hypothetical protein